MVTGNVNYIIEKVNKLPTLPTVANKITRLIKDPTCTARKVSEVIDKDQSLTCRVLRLVNSAFYALTTEVINVRHAVALLGFRTISQLAISISVFDVFKGGYGKEFDREGFWLHSIGCAVISQMLAEKIQYSHIDESFSAGLMHDIGKVVLDHYFHEELLKIIELTWRKGLSFVEAEQEVIGLNHTEIGSRVMRNWNIPLPIVAGVRHHHQLPCERRGSPYAQDIIVDIVRLANVLCKKEKIGCSGDNVVPELSPELWERLPISVDTLTMITKDCGKEIEKASVLLELT